MNNTNLAHASAPRRWIILVFGLLLLGATPQVPAQTMDWSPATMFFEDVPVGTTAFQTLNLINDGEVPLTIDGIEWTFNQVGMVTLHPQFGFEADRPIPAVLLAGESMEVSISFAPEEAFSFASANLLVTSDAGPLNYWIDGTGSEDDACAPFSSCAGVCTDLQNDLNNCGSCGNVCPIPEVGLPVCEAGVCGYTCDESIDLSSDPLNCGTCGNTCDVPTHGTATCEDGNCGFVCDEGYEQVGDTCQAIVVKTPKEMIDALVAFAQESVDSGTLLGLGPSGNDQQGEALLKIFMHHLEKAQTFIDAGELMLACGRLNSIQLRCDGGWPFVMPPDFVAGEAASEVYDRIIELMESIDGCTPREAPTRL